MTLQPRFVALLVNAFSLVSMFYVNIAVADPIFISPDGSAVITTIPITSISNTSVNSTLITSTFPGWSVINGGTGPGSVTIPPPTYTAAGNSNSGGAYIIATYSNPPSIGWIQIVTSNANTISPCLSSPCVDVLPTSTTPFVPSNFINPFHDFSSRDYADLASVGSISWSANLYPADATGVTA